MEPDLGGEEPERRDWLAAFSRPDTEWDYKRFETKVRVNLKPLTSTFRSDVFEDSDGASWRLLFELKVKPSDKKALGVFLEFKPLSGARQARRKFSFTLDSWPEDLTEEPDGTAISREPPHSFNATYSFDASSGTWGCPQFLPLSLLNQAVPDNEAVFTVRMTLLPPESPDTAYNSKHWTGCVGLLNQGATCYMNSLLQSLFHTRVLRRAVLQMASPRELLSENMVLALQLLFLELQVGTRYVSTKSLTRSFGWNSLDAFQQQDVQELNRVLCDRLEERMRGSSADGLIKRLFRGEVRQFVRCLHVDYVSERTDEFYDLQLDVQGCDTVADSFRRYTEPERLDGDNKYDAGEEHGKQDAEKGVIFQSLPPVLHLHLKRFTYNMWTDSMVKVNDRHEFGVNMDLSEFVTPARAGGQDGKDEDGKVKSDGEASDPLPPTLYGPDDELPLEAYAAAPPHAYTLHSVLVHSGSLHGGHYYTYVRPSSNPRSRRWLLFDDETVMPVKEQEAVERNWGGAASVTSAYMLVYIRVRDLPWVMKGVPDTAIPPALSTRADAERGYQKRLAKLRRRAASRVVVRAVGLQHLAGASFCECRNDFAAWDEGARVSVDGDTTFRELAELLAAPLGVPAEMQQMWRCNWRRNYRALRPLEPVTLDVEQVALTTLRARARRQTREQEAREAAKGAAGEGGDGDGSGGGAPGYAQAGGSGAGVEGEKEDDGVEEEKEEGGMEEEKEDEKEDEKDEDEKEEDGSVADGEEDEDEDGDDDSSVDESPMTDEERARRAYEQQWSQPVSSARATELCLFVRPVTEEERDELLDTLLRVNQNAAVELMPIRDELEEHERQLQEWRQRRQDAFQAQVQAGALAASGRHRSLGGKEPRPQYLHAPPLGGRPLAGYDDAGTGMEEEGGDDVVRAEPVNSPVGTDGVNNPGAGHGSEDGSTAPAPGGGSADESSDEEWTGGGGAGGDGEEDKEDDDADADEEDDSDDDEEDEEERGGGLGAVTGGAGGGGVGEGEADPFGDNAEGTAGEHHHSGLTVGQSETEIVPADGSKVNLTVGEAQQGGGGDGGDSRKRDRAPEQPQDGAPPPDADVGGDAEEVPQAKRLRTVAQSGGDGSCVSDSTDSAGLPGQSRWDGDAQALRDNALSGMQNNPAAETPAWGSLQSSHPASRPSSPEPVLPAEVEKRRKEVELVYGNGGWQALPVGALMIVVKQYDGSASVEGDHEHANKAGELRRRVKALGTVQMTRQSTLSWLLDVVRAPEPGPGQRITVWETLDLSRSGPAMMPEHTESLDRTLHELGLASGDVLWAQVQDEDEVAPAGSRSPFSPAPDVTTDGGIRIEEVDEGEEEEEGGDGAEKAGAAHSNGGVAASEAQGEGAVPNGAAAATEAAAPSLEALFKGATPHLYARPRGEGGQEVERAGLAPLYPAPRVRFAPWLPLFRRAHTVREAHTHVRRRVFMLCKPAAVPDGPGVVVEMSIAMTLEQAQEAVASALGVRSGGHVALYLRAETPVHERIGQRHNMGRSAERYSPFGCHFNWFLPSAKPVNLVVARHGGRHPLLGDEPMGDPLPSLYYEVQPRVPRALGQAGGGGAEVLMPLRARLDPKLWLRLWKERARRIQEERRERKKAEEEEEEEGEGGEEEKDEEENKEEEEEEGSQEGRPLVEALAERSDADILDELVKEREEKEGERRLKGGAGSLEVWRDEAKARALAEDEEARAHDEEVARVQEEFHEELDAELGFRLLVPCWVGPEQVRGCEASPREGAVVGGRAVLEALHRIGAATGCRAVQHPMRLLQQVGWWVKSVEQLHAAEFRFDLRHLQSPEQEVTVLEPSWSWDAQQSREFKSLVSKQLPSGAAAALRLVQFCHAERRGSRRPRLFGPTQLLLVHSHVSLQEALQEARRRMGFEDSGEGSLPSWQPCAATEQREAQRMELVPLEPRSGLTVYAAQALLGRQRSGAPPGGESAEGAAAAAASGQALKNEATALGVEASPLPSPSPLPPPPSTPAQGGSRASGSKASSEAEAEQLLADLAKVSDEDLRTLTTGEPWFDHLTNENPESPTTPPVGGTPAVLVLHHTNLLARGRRRPPRGPLAGPQGVHIR